MDVRKSSEHVMIGERKRDAESSDAVSYCLQCMHGYRILKKYYFVCFIGSVDSGFVNTLKETPGTYPFI